MDGCSTVFCGCSVNRPVWFVNFSVGYRDAHITSTWNSPHLFLGFVERLANLFTAFLSDIRLVGDICLWLWGACWVFIDCGVFELWPSSWCRCEIRRFKTCANTLGTRDANRVSKRLHLNRFTPSFQLLCYCLDRHTLHIRCITLTRHVSC